jgi:hypothetical protein
MRILVFILISLLYSLNTTHAQNSIRVGLQVSPAISRILDNIIYKGYKYQTNVNFGATVDFDRLKWGLSTGILHQQLGSKFEVEKATIDFPEGIGEFYDVNFYIRSIAIPLKLYYNIPLSSRFTLSPNAGIIPNFIYSQTFEVPENTVLPPYEAVTDIEMFNALYVSAYAGVSLKHAINDTWSIEVMPGFSYQFGSQHPDFNSSSRPVIIAFSAELGVKYKLR